MKNKFLLVALIGVLLVAGIVLVSCGSRCPGDGECAHDPADIAGTALKMCNTTSSNSNVAQRVVDCGLAKGQAILDREKYECDC